MNRIIYNEIPNTLLTESYELILVPTKAIARSINVAHFTLEDIAETIVKKKGLRIASALLTRRLLQTAIANILKVKDIVGITKLWTPIIQELLSSGSDLFTLQYHSLNRISQLAKVAIFYREQLRKINCLDRSELFWEATNHCRSTKNCLFYGYFSFNSDRLAFINALAGNNSLLVLPNREIEIFSENKKSIAWLQSQKWQIYTKSRSLPLSKIFSLGKQLPEHYLEIKKNLADYPRYSFPSSQVTLNNYANLEAEVRGVLTQVKLLLERNISPQDIVITTKDEQLYGATLLDIAWEYDLPLRAFYDVSLLTTRFGAWLQLLLEIIVEFNNSNTLPFESTIKLLSHPLVKQLDTEILNKARLNRPQNITEWQSIGIDFSLLRLPQEVKSDRWILILKNILEFFTISEKVKLWAKEIVAYYKFQEALQELLLTTNKVIKKETLVTEIQELLTSLNIPIQPGRGGVELHSPLSLFGSRYQYVFVLGMAENIFPNKITDDVVLNLSDRKLLERENINLNTINKLVKQEELAFYFLLNVPIKQIIFSYPQLVDRQPCYPSPYLKYLNLKVTPVAKNYLASVEEARQIYLLKENNSLKIEQNLPNLLLESLARKWQRESDRDAGILNEYNGSIGISLDYQKFTFSASQLTQIGQCPFKWFATRLLKLKEIVETKLTLEPNLRGSLYHQCLELCLAEINTAADLEKFNLQQLNKAFTEAEKILQLPTITSWTWQKQESLKLLAINLTTPNFLPQDSEIIEREKEFKTKWYGLNIKGIIDRLDRTPQGIKVIDYKSSSSPPVGIKDESGKANIDIQIPLYTDAMAQEYPAEKIDAVYYSLSKSKPIRRNKTNPEELANFAEKVKQHLTEGSYPIKPDVQFKACNYCQFDLVCRKSVIGNR